MNEKDPLVTTERKIDRPPRLRVNTAGLSEETRRELELVEFEAAEQILPAGSAGGMTVRRGTAEGRTLREGDQTVNTEEVWKVPPARAGVDGGNSLPAGLFETVENRPGIDKGPERVENPDVLEHHLSPTLSPILQMAERENAGRSHGFEKSPVAGNHSGENQFPEGEGRQWSQAVETIKGVGFPGADQGRQVQELKSGNESFGEGFNPTLAGDSTLLRPGRARSGARAGRLDTQPAMARELPPAGPGPSATGRREESERLAELHAAVKENIAHSQQTHAAVLQTLRDSARLHTAHRAELDRLAAQVKMLLGQSENAGFNRQ